MFELGSGSLTPQEQIRIRSVLETEALRLGTLAQVLNFDEEIHD